MHVQALMLLCTESITNLNKLFFSLRVFLRYLNVVNTVLDLADDSVCYGKAD
jgi:hypothetical protein